MLETLNRVSKILAKIGNNTLQYSGVKELMKNEKFDLIILGYYMNEYMLGLGDHFKCPTILFSATNLLTSLLMATGNPFSLEASNHFLLQGQEHDFLGRFKNFLMHAFDFIVLSSYFEYYGKEVYRLVTNNFK